jgi:diaminohydroxyphosphoribosylaminopyrimidine deaminase/5-amino-6-(5-phosphoribosylamino)uracil reductase
MKEGHIGRSSCTYSTAVYILPPEAKPGIFIMSARTTNWTKKDQEFMRLALDLAEKGRGKTSPNPMVGAVVIKNGKIIAKGYHKKFGGPHAEAIAIKACKREAKGATLYTTLEPCCHFGKTPPCTDLIIQSGIKKVVCAAIDPNPMVNGKGLKYLTKQGIRVSLGLMEDEAKRLNQVHFKFMTSGLPFVVLKVAQSLDGRVIRYTEKDSGKNQDFDAILCEAGIFETQSVATLFKSSKSNKPRLILLGTKKQIENTTKKTPGKFYQRIIAVPTDGESIGFRNPNDLCTWKVKKTKNGEVDLLPLLKKAGKEGISSLLVDGGKELYTRLLKRELADKTWYFIAPRFKGKGEEPFGDLGIRKISKCVTIRDCEFKQLKQGLQVVGYINKTNKR